MFAVHQYRQGVQLLVAACDVDLLETEHAEGELRLSVPASFYDGDRTDEAGLKSALGGATVANLVGPKTLAVAVAMGMVDQENVANIGGVPHAQLMVL